MTRIHKKYKLQQRHVIKLLETMNFDNCRVIIDSECVRTESMIFETNLTHPDLNIPSTESDSDLEYLIVVCITQLFKFLSTVFF
jgi:hypothetical protein